MSGIIIKMVQYPHIIELGPDRGNKTGQRLMIVETGNADVGILYMIFSAFVYVWKDRGLVFSSPVFPFSPCCAPSTVPLLLSSILSDGLCFF